MSYIGRFRRGPERFLSLMRRRGSRDPSLRKAYEHCERVLSLPPMTEAEAQALRDRHLAERGVTVCPPGARPEEPLFWDLPTKARRNS